MDLSHMNPTATPLGYDFDALEPALSRETVLHHFFQHHCDCYRRLATLVQGTPLESLSLEMLIDFTDKRHEHARVHALALDAWCHDLYWQSLKPGGGGRSIGLIDRAIRRSFGGLPQLVRSAKSAAEELAGSGWLWLVWCDGKLEIMTGSTAQCPIADSQVVLLAIDLWEHAYYLDYYGARCLYVAACFRRLVNWTFANQRLLHALGRNSRARLALMWLAGALPPPHRIYRTERLPPPGTPAH
jgi:superoxide dismutase, Fe-Mn family